MENNNHTGKSILVIEDCDVTRERLWLVFKDTCRVLLAATAAEGLDLLSGDVAVVLLDYVLPDKEGADVLIEIKNRQPSVPVIVMTGYGNEEICQKVFRSGAIDYIKKPFDTKEIKTKVELLIKIRGEIPECRKPVFLGSLSDRPKNPFPEVPEQILDGIMKAKKYVEEHYAENVRIPQMIREAATNRTYFCTYFKLITGYTFKDYLLNRRLGMAKELLKHKHLQISDVAEQVGYSPKYFSEVFKKSFGFPPKRTQRK